MSEPIMQFFKFDHLPEKLQLVSKPFGDLAQRLEETLPRNAERSVALRKLLEAKDAAVRALLAVAALLVLFFPVLAFAQAAAAAPAGDPAWLKLAAIILPILLPVLVAIHPLLKLAAYLHAKTEDVGLSQTAKMAFLGGESVAKSLDHFLEASAADAADLADPSKRAAAIKHIENEAKTDALPALGAAAQAMGAGWVTGLASQAIDKALASAPAVAVSAVTAALAPAPPRPPPTTVPS